MNNAENLLKHVETLCVNYWRFTGRELIDAAAANLIQRMAEAPFAVVSHGTQADPVFNYANNRALELFEMTWEEFTALPSRLSAEAPDQAERSAATGAGVTPRLCGRLQRGAHLQKRPQVHNQECDGMESV